MHVTLRPTTVVMTLTSPSDLDVNEPSTVEQSVFGPPLYKPVSKKTAMHAENLAILSGTFIIPKFIYGMC